jgi:hypothetical protein
MIGFSARRAPFCVRFQKRVLGMRHFHLFQGLWTRICVLRVATGALAAMAIMAAQLGGGGIVRFWC